MIPLPIYHSICVGRVDSLMGHSATAQDFDFIHNAIKIDATRAVDAYNDKRTDEFTPESFPCCVSPWPVAWIEYSLGGEVFLKGKPHTFPKAKSACLSRCLDREVEGAKVGV